MAMIIDRLSSESMRQVGFHTIRIISSRQKWKYSKVIKKEKKRAKIIHRALGTDSICISESTTQKQNEKKKKFDENYSQNEMRCTNGVMHGSTKDNKEEERV